VKPISQSFLLILFFAVVISFAKAQLRPEKHWRNIEPETAELFSYIRHKKMPDGKYKSGFSFKYGVRSDVAPEIIEIQITYGHINWNNDSDWFMVRGERSRIKDLGELNWSQILNVPFLPPRVKPYRGFKLPSPGETVEQASEGQITKVLPGHMYVLHAKEARTDLYALFRVEKLEPNDKVTISWKLVPMPKK
jgi:hypothetical protein